MNKIRRTFANALAVLLTTAALLVPAAAGAQVTVNQILFPSNIGRTLQATVSIDYTRTSSAAAVIDTPLPAQLSLSGISLPAACVNTASAPQPPVVQCTVPAGGAGATSTIEFSVRGEALGSFSLVATGTGGSNASNTGTVRSSGELTVQKTRTPTGGVLTGQTMGFTLRPQLATGADDLPTGATLTIVDQLPGLSANWNLTAISSGTASCNSVAAANADGTRRVSCTLSGPLTVAQVNAVVISLTGQARSAGNFTNVGSVSADQALYFDRNTDNNTVNVDYTVEPASDLQAQGSFPSTPVATGSAQTLRLTYRNNGPSNLPANGTVSTTIPAGFTVTSLPAACTGPALNVVLVAPQVVSCSAVAAASGTAQDFDMGLTMPSTATGGNFTVTVAPPSGFGDAVSTNNSVDLPYTVTAPYADLRLTKAKSPASGPVAPGSTVTTTLTVVNDAASTSTASYSAQSPGGSTPLRVVDYLRPEEIAGDTVSAVSAGWACTVSLNADPADATRSRRVLCERVTGGTLAPGASLAVSFSTTVAAVTGQVTLANRACTGATLLTILGLTSADGPQPPEAAGQTANDCSTAGSALIATDVGSGNAAVNIVKVSSNDGTTWVDAVGAAPTIAAAQNTQFWRITITTPAGGAQATVPTLNLSDPLPGILNVSSPGAPAPGYVTPAINVSTVLSGVGGGGCPSTVAAGSSQLNCSFTQVAPGASITVLYQVQRPFSSGTLTNTATLTSPDAILTGTTSDAAALVVQPRIDVATTTKTVTPLTPRIGQTLQFTITAQNLGPDDVTAVGDFKLIDDINTDTTLGIVAFGDITPSGANMSCAVAGSALPDEPNLFPGRVRVRCTNTTAVVRYSTRTVTISARVLKPSSALPASGNVYSGQSNTARIDIPDSLCEWKDETSTNAGLSSSCNDGHSTSNNSRTVSFDVLVPQIDVQQRKTRVLPVGQTAFGIGQPLRYRFRLQNNGPSRAEGVQMVDRLTVPSGFTLSGATVHAVNAAAAESGYVLDTTKNASVSCSQPAPNGDVSCVLSTVAAQNYLDSGREVNFEIELAQSGNAFVPVSLRNEALVCADETAAYETAGACNRSAANNNNLAAVNDTLFPRTDLAVAKSTLTASPAGVNAPVRWQIVVRNHGPNATQRLRVVDTLPAGFELITSGPNAPSVSVGNFVLQPPSSASGAQLSCNAVPAAVTAAGQQQVVTCNIDAVPGPLGSGAFPGSNDAANTLTLVLAARPKDGVFAGPYLADLSNSASVSPGLDGNGNALSIDTVSGNNSATAVVQVNRARLSGRVFIDRNGNGAQDGTAPTQDEGVGGVNITLSGTDAYGNAVSRTQSSVNSVGATRGDFLFDHLPPGSYTVTESQPTTLVNSVGTPVAASAGGQYQAAPTASTSHWSAVTLAIGDSATGYLFPEQLPPGTISGTVFVDRADNGALDSGDPPIAGVTVALYNAGTVCPANGALPGGALATTTTDAAGSYRFTGSSGNSYVVCQQQPVGHADRNPIPGGNGSTPRANQIDITNLQASGSSGNHFPEVLGRISGTVFADFNSATPATNNNGVQNAGEPGIGSGVAGAGVPITLTGTPSAGPSAGVAIAARTVHTAADGSYAFDDLFPGSYTVTEGAIPAGLGSYGEGINTAGPVAGGTPGAAGAVGDNVVRDIVLASAGASSTGNNFAELPRVGISGVVYSDRDRSGTRNSGDGVIGGVTIELRQGGTSCANGTLLGSTTTAADGSYGFPGGNVASALVLAGSTYRICQQQPAAYADGAVNPGGSGSTSAANDIVVTNLPSAGSAGNDFGERAASIAGSVFVDQGGGSATDNGRRDAGEAGIANVPITLLNADSGATIATLLTDADGRYRFDDLPTGRYTLREGAIPAGSGSFINGRTSAGTVDGNLAGLAGVDQIQSVLLPPGGVGLNHDFGELLAGGAPPVAFISGMVFVDRDRDGRFGDADTSRIPGVSVILVAGTSCSGPELARTVTLSNGYFSFTSASFPFGVFTVGGDYSLCQVQPPYADGATLPAAGASTPAPNHIVIRQLGPEGSTGHRFAELGARLSGSVYLDMNNDGAFVPGPDGERGLPNVAVVLSGPNLPEPRRALTDGQGHFAFEDLPGGSFTLTEQELQPAIEIGRNVVSSLDGRTTPGSTGGQATPVETLPSALAGIVLAPGGSSERNLFGELLPARIAGRVWLDGNGNGSIDGAEPGLAGVTLVLSGTDDQGRAVQRMVQTAADGSWSFEGLRPGRYTVTQPEQPPDTRNGNTVAGTAGGQASTPATVPSRIADIVLRSGSNSLDNLFGEVPLRAAISGRVWLDRNDNGRIDSGEAGIEGVPVELTGTDSAGRSVRRSTRTDAQGHWSFDDLPAGTYRVVEPTQPAGTFNGRTVPASSGGSASPSTVLPSSISGISVALGQTSTDNNFGELPPAAVSGRVWLDADDDGRIGAQESGIAGVVVQLRGTDDLGAAVQQDTVSDAQGRWRFDNLRPGTYTVIEPQQPPDTVNGRTVPGSLGGQATAVGTLPSSVDGIVLPAGGEASDNLFGERSPSPDLRVSKLARESRFIAGRTGRYAITVRNAGSAATTGAYTVTDRLPPGLSLSGTPAGTGWSCGAAPEAGTFSCSSSVDLAPGASHPGTIEFAVRVGEAAAASSPVHNAVLVEGGGEPPAARPGDAERAAHATRPQDLPGCATAPAHNACRSSVEVLRQASVSGTVWLDAGPRSRELDAQDRRLAGWRIEIVDPASGTVVATATSGDDGRWRVEGLDPGTPYQIRFRDPASGTLFGTPVNGETGTPAAACAAAVQPSSCADRAPAPQLSVVLAPGQELREQSLPLQPGGVVYDAVTREPVAGAVVSLQPLGGCSGWDPAQHVAGALLGGYRVQGALVSMTTGVNGWYQFLLTPTAPARCTFAIGVAPPATLVAPSLLIPPQSRPFPNTGTALTASPVQPQALAPTGPPGSGTQYHLAIEAGSLLSDVVHNHLPLDPALPAGLALDKGVDRSLASLGDLLRYRIGVRVTAGAPPRQLNVVDRLPRGFAFVPGSARADDRRIDDPRRADDGSLVFELGPMPASGVVVLSYRVRIGVGAAEGDGINRAIAHACAAAGGCVEPGSSRPITLSRPSNRAEARVRVAAGAFADEACFAGKVFVDCNRNHVQDAEELGIPGVRLVLSDGSTLISDSEGKYALCGLPPRSHVLRIDETTLPRGSRLGSTSNRNLGDAGSLWLDLKRGELHRADFAEASCSNPVLDQVKARRAQGEVRAPETEKPGRPALRLDSKSQGLPAQTAPRQATDSANQPLPRPRPPDDNPRPAPAANRLEDRHGPR